MSKISTGTLLNTGFVVTSDTSGNLVVQTGASSNTAVVIDANGTVNFGYTTNFSSPLSLNGGTANGVSYLNASKVLTTGSALTFNGTTLVAPDITDSSLTSGRITYAGTGGNLVDSANLTFNGTTLSAAGLSDSGNFTFTGTGNRITGDFSNATLANRVAFQTNSANNGTNIHAIPNGTATSTGLKLETDPLVTNGSVFAFDAIGGSDMRIGANIRGSGTYLPITFTVGGSERVRIDTSGNVGIGTSSPSAALDVAGTSVITTTNDSGYSVLRLRNTAASGKSYEIGVGGSNSGAVANSWYVYDQTAATVRFLVNTSGNMGVGTASPNTRLDVSQSNAKSATGIWQIQTFDSTSQTTGVGGGISFGGYKIGVAAQEVFGAIDGYKENSTSGNAAGALRFHTQPAAGSGLVERARINSAGNVGVATISPSARLDVNNQDAADTIPLALSNNIGGTDAATSGINFNAHTVNFARIVGGQQTSGTFADGNLRFLTRNAETVAERMRITSAGNVGIGTNAPAAKLTVAGSFAVGGIRIQDTDVNQAAPALEIIGQRLDGNGSVSFSGKALLARHRTDAAITSGISVGGILFGGNHTSSSASNILYTASITGVSEGTFSSSSSMPTALAFLTGYPGISPDTANASAGTERMRIDSIGNIQIGNASAADTAGRFFDIYNTGSSSGAYSIMRLITQQVASSSTTSADFVKYKNGVLAINNNDTSSATATVFGIGGSERMRILSNGSTSYSGQQLVQNYYQTGSITPTGSKWWRICTLPTTNQTQYVEFLLTNPGVHLIMKVKFSKSTAGALGGGGVLEVEQLGSYSYWNYYPFDWRLVDGGTNLPSHIDVRFNSNNNEPFAYRLQVLHSWSAETTVHATFPFSDQGTGTTGSYYVNMGNGSGGWTKQWFKMTGSKYAFYDSSLSFSSGQTPPTA